MEKSSPDPVHEPGIDLVLGHASSGKSLWAERLAFGMDWPLTYVATARVADEEMRAKVARHVERRGPDWQLIEEETDLAGRCAAMPVQSTVLVDCATMWLTNLMMDGADWQSPAEAWLAAMQDAPARFVVVSNDVGGGVTPDNALARAFQRAQGELNQRLAQAADRAFLVTAGLAQRLR
ncbi:bifunctional adenosylcobinamide kinase/adenosylcobinamide-phosphate guanylyltransferase [Jannaschia sp. S6380]|uniref:bifunctional adenosylcobinamide kinase/adenosylcobinamide-phosphate guanylyltransferase n=1 Tax=Jannaschia sp. S6380 TaxID=2926408 RepID=UPI001FF56FFD|nr:bifunctional adenosylcobinamide kinase/adenosylcobinamide-phosphate guanylyltransferase [Jannaschia sp. S6380]MCK0168082.1 bifunctional adenosylcobinamide kinase/adenosylcobinamide-phosphate guanylyltransferase [Jannaschia sp. S6380]